MRTDPDPRAIALTVPFRLRRMAALVVAAVACSTLAVTVPFGRADAATPEVVTGRLSGKADFSNAGGTVDKVVTSGDGRFAAFTATGNDVVPGLPSGTDRVYVRDTLTDALELVSVDAAGAPLGSSRVGAITPDGRYVAFVSSAPGVPADTNDDADVYVRDRKLQTTERVSVNSAEVGGDGDSGDYSGGATLDISDDGRYVVFESLANNLGPTSDGNGYPDIYRRDRTNGTTARVSVAAATPGNYASRYPSMSADGMLVAFATEADNLVPNDTNGTYDIVLKRMDGSPSNTRISLGLDANPDGYSNQPEISANGNLVVFTSNAPDLVAGDTNQATDVFVRNVSAATTTRASVWTGGGQINGASNDASISPDGTRITFETQVRLSPALDGDQLDDVYLREAGTTSRQSVGPGASDTSHFATSSSVSNDSVVWVTSAKMASVDTNNWSDAFVRRTPFIGAHTSFEHFATITQARITGVADPAKVTAAATALRSGASPEHQVVQLVDQPAFSAKKAPVIRLYWAYFKRRPDLDGLNYWIKQYATGAKSLQRISLSFATSSEFKTKYGNTTPSQFVTLVYQNVLERQPEADGLAYWSKKIEDGTSRGQVMTSFSESPEGKRVMAPYVDTVLIGLGMIGQIPSKPLFDAAVADAKAGWPRETIVDYVLGAPEYAASL